MLFVILDILFIIIFVINIYKTILYYFNFKVFELKSFISFLKMTPSDFLNILPTTTLLLILHLCSMLTLTNIVLSIALLVYTISYTSHKLTITAQGRQITWPYSLKVYLKDLSKWSFDFFLSVTPLNHIWYILCDEANTFKLVLKRCRHDILVGLFIINPTKFDYEEMLEEQYNFQKKMFKYKKPVHPRDMYKKLSQEDLKKLEENIKANRTPSNALNSVKRLPWVFDYSVQIDEVRIFILRNIIVLYNFLKTTILALLLAVIYFIYTIFFFKIQFLKQISVWFIIGMMYFWLMSGFNFFLKRYQYGKFTSAIQRFWKRTNTYFWMIEGFLILIFFYYYINSSQEPVYMYDYSALNQEYLVSLHVAGTNVILLSLIIYFMYFIILRINSNSWSQLSLYLLLISFFIFFSFYIETYQFYYVISTFNERLWAFNEDENLWSIETDNPILRTKHQYLLACLIAKYWHFLFIFLSWVFFLIKSFEKKKVTFVLFGANLQNMIILYVLNFACYIQWFKWLYRRFADLPYTWFMANIDTKLIFRLFSEIKLLWFNIINSDIKFTYFDCTTYKSLSLWTVDSLVIWKFL